MKISKKLKYYLDLPYTIELIPDNEGYFAKIKELPGCMSQGDTEEDAVKNVNEAKHLWLSTALKKGINIPKPEVDEEYSGKFLIRIPKSLHGKLSRLAKKEETSLNQLILNLLSERSGEMNVEDAINKCLKRIMESDRRNTEIINNSYTANIPKHEDYPSTKDSMFSWEDKNEERESHRKV